jgi:hypothetical protein
MSPPFKKRRVDDGTTTSKSKSKSKSKSNNKHYNQHNKNEPSIKITTTRRNNVHPLSEDSSIQEYDDGGGDGVGYNENNVAASTRSTCCSSKEKVLLSSSSSYVNAASAQYYDNYDVDYPHDHPYMSLYPMSMMTNDADELVVETTTTAQEEARAIDDHTNDEVDDMKKKKKKKSCSNDFCSNSQVSNSNSNSKSNSNSNDDIDNDEETMILDDFYYDYSTNDIVLIKRNKTHCRSDDGCKCDVVCDDDERQIIASASAVTTRTSSPALPQSEEKYMISNVNNYNIQNSKKKKLDHQDKMIMMTRYKNDNDKILST